VGWINEGYWIDVGWINEGYWIDVGPERSRNWINEGARVERNGSMRKAVADRCAGRYWINEWVVLAYSTRN